MKNVILLFCLIATIHCKQHPSQPGPEPNPFGRFERWLNGPVSKDYPNKQDFDSIYGITFNYRDGLIRAKKQLACIKMKKKDVYDYHIQTYNDISW